LAPDVVAFRLRVLWQQQDCEKNDPSEWTRIDFQVVIKDKIHLGKKRAHFGDPAISPPSTVIDRDFEIPPFLLLV
jgi:hypothetical protein